MARLFFVMALAGLGASCALFPGGGPDKVLGKYEGGWYLGNTEQPVGGLKATIEPGEKKGDYKAIFDASFGGRAMYNVPLKGHREKDKVTFEGAEDLGPAGGGVFNWTGEINGKEFLGKYTSRTYTGTFKMTKVQE